MFLKLRMMEKPTSLVHHRFEALQL